MDIYTKEKRSELMSKIRGRMTALEERGWLVLREAGFRFRKHPKGIFGRPDAANKSKKIAIFIDSAFWHGYDWKNRRKDFKSNRSFWIAKIERNIQRDKDVNKELNEHGWRVVRIWDYQLTRSNRAKTIRRLQKIWNEVGNSTNR